MAYIFLSMVVASMLIVVQFKYIAYVSDVIHGPVIIRVANGVCNRESGSGPELKASLAIAGEILKSVPGSTFSVIWKFGEVQLITIKGNDPDENKRIINKCTALLPNSRLTSRCTGADHNA